MDLWLLSQRISDLRAVPAPLRSCSHPHWGTPAAPELENSCWILVGLGGWNSIWWGRGTAGEPSTWKNTPKLSQNILTGRDPTSSLSGGSIQGWNDTLGLSAPGSDHGETKAINKNVTNTALGSCWRAAAVSGGSLWFQLHSCPCMVCTGMKLVNAERVGGFCNCKMHPKFLINIT